MVYKIKTPTYNFLGGFMKIFFRVIGIFTLLIGSFIYNEKVATTSKQTDTLLDEIKTKSINYKIEPKEAIIKDNTIIPGINGKQVDIKKSYEKIREIGYFNDKLLVYKQIQIKNKLKNNQDKYIISGNLKKREVSLIFKINNDITSILNILNKEKGTFYITSTFLENNHNLVIEMLKEGHTIGNLSNNRDYTDSDFIWMKTIITSTKYQKNNYCYAEEENEEIIKICKLHSSYTVMPLVIKDKPFITLKNNLKEGGIYSFEVNNKLKEELPNIINYINAKGYKIKSLENLLDENKY